MADTPPSKRRGCDWDDFGNAFAITLVRAAADEVADAAAALTGGSVERMDPLRPPEPVPHYGGIVFQPAGHEWTVATLSTHNSDHARALSASLQTRAICLLHEDTGAWTEYRLFDSGDTLESYLFGPDYSEEFGDAAEELGESIGQIMPSDEGTPWDHRLKHNGEEFLFRSTLRKVKPSAVHDWKKMLDDALKSADAWLPGWAHWPWADAKRFPSSPRSQFADVYRVL
jgi:hypothetical protein